MKLVCTAIGLQASAEAVNELSREKDQQINRLTERVEALERMVQAGGR
ncbi:MAG: hypothetical protein P9M08_06405 [Candidatus Erginobacter occultus]|nr:hypothetical protein [Candidatus Erginobacter occultus]